MGIWLSQYIAQSSYLNIYWALQAGHVTLLSAYRLATHNRPRAPEVDPADRKLGWLEFRKHPTLCYVVGCAWSIYVLWTVIGSYCYDSVPGERFEHLYDFLTTPRQPATDVLCTYVGLALYSIHIVRRLYECLKISIFSRHRTTGLVTFLTDLFFYVGAGLSLIATGPELSRQTDCFGALSSLRWYQIPAIAVFFFAAKVQNDSFQQLQKLRRNRAGHIVTTGYKMPRGGWFDRLQLSSPHYLAEILIHVSVGVALGMHNVTWWLLTGYVAMNHVHMAYDKQLFYRSKFTDYPTQRRMLLPYIF